MKYTYHVDRSGIDTRQLIYKYYIRIYIYRTCYQHRFDDERTKLDDLLVKHLR